MRTDLVRFPSAAGLALALALALAAGCAPEERAGRGPAPAPVTVAQVQVRPVDLSLAAVGTVEPAESVSVRSQVAGQLARIAFEEGADVVAGQLLFEIDPRSFAAELAAAEARLARDRAQLANARQQAERFAELVAKDYVTRSQFDDARTAAEALAATVRADEQEVAGARLLLERATIEAPIAGRTGAVHYDLGDLVPAGGENPLTVINRIEPIEVGFSLPAEHLATIQRRQASGPLAVTARLPGSATGAVEGRLTFVDNRVDPATGTLLLKATFPNEDRSLWPGQFVHVELVLEPRAESVVVPEQAVQIGQTGAYVFVVTPERTAEQRPITVVRQAGPWTIVGPELAPGETVVTDGQVRLVAGASVEVLEPAGATPPRP